MTTMIRHRRARRGFTITEPVAALAVQLMAEYAASYAAYERDCESDRERGYRPHYCEHGISLWTEYDNICGGCEDGISMGDPAQRRERALNEAKERIRKADVLFEALEILRGADIVVDRKAVYAHALSLATTEPPPF